MRGYGILKFATTTLNKKNDSALYDIKTEIDVKDKWPLSRHPIYILIRMLQGRLYFM